jgi:hypothetical protein
MSGKCTAGSKRTGEACKANAVTGRSVCYHHGGASRTGLAHPNLTTGRYSKHLPTRMGERYQQALADPELLAMREEVALIDSRLSDVLSRVDTGESGKAWAELQKAWKIYRTGPPGQRLEAEARISDLIHDGASDYEAWSEVREIVDQRARLVANERQRLVQMQQMLSVEQAMTLMAAVADAVRRHVHDRDALAGISADLARIVAGGPGRADQPA